MDEDCRFSLGSDEFSRLIGSRTAAAFGRLWSEIAEALKIDPEGKVAAAVATRGTWSGIVVDCLQMVQARGFPSNYPGSRFSIVLEISSAIAASVSAAISKILRDSLPSAATRCCIRERQPLQKTSGQRRVRRTRRHLRC